MPPKAAPSDRIDEKLILQSLQEEPRSLRDLAKALGLPSSARKYLQHQLHAMVEHGAVVLIKGGLFAPGETKSRRPGLTGRVVQKQADYAFVIPEEPGQSDIYVVASDLLGALPDDTVEVRVLSGSTGTRRQGKVIRVIKRGRERIVGTFRLERKVGLVRPDGLAFVPDFLIPTEDQKNARPGEKVVAQITAWPEGYVPGRGKVMEVLGAPDRVGVDITVIVRKYNLPEHHSEEAVEEARRISREPGAEAIAGRLDLRAQRIVTIDGDDARDFDDAVSCEDRPGGGWRLGVHIADVSYYLQENSVLDLEARDRGTSVYLPDRVLHMLPEPLSCGVCSLVPGKDRLTVSAYMDVEPDGTIAHTEFFRSVIHSQGRLTYNGVEAVISGKSGELPASEFKPELLRLNQVAHAIRRDREKRGSLDFDLPEPKVILGPDGHVETIAKRISLASHRLIEDCMIAANEAVARFLTRTDTPALYRVHDQPSGDKYEELMEFVKAYGYRFESGAPREASLAFQKLLRSWQGKPEATLLNMVLLRSLKMAVYTPRNIGHFGLASSCYTHFTSPIRRYPDLIVHRVLTARLAGVLSPQVRAGWVERMPGWGTQLSEAERRAERAEREAVSVKQAEFMQERVGEVFSGTITNITNFGFFVELNDVFVEGLVKLGSLGDDYYVFHERERRLIGERHRRTFKLGDPVTVQVMRVNKEEGLVDFAIYAEAGTKRRQGSFRPRSTRPPRNIRRKRR